jgi:hypothetical protein
VTNVNIDSISKQQTDVAKPLQLRICIIDMRSSSECGRFWTDSVGWWPDAAAEVYASPGVERLTGPRFETAGENLQKDANIMILEDGYYFR